MKNLICTSWVDVSVDLPSTPTQLVHIVSSEQPEPPAPVENSDVELPNTQHNETEQEDYIGITFKLLRVGEIQHKKFSEEVMMSLHQNELDVEEDIVYSPIEVMNKWMHILGLKNIRNEKKTGSVHCQAKILWKLSNQETLPLLQDLMAFLIPYS